MLAAVSSGMSHLLTRRDVVSLRCGSIIHILAARKQVETVSAIVYEEPCVRGLMYAWYIAVGCAPAGRSPVHVVSHSNVAVLSLMLTAHMLSPKNCLMMQRAIDASKRYC